MYVEPETFGRQLKFLSRHFDVVSLDSLRTRNKSDMDRREKICVLTFDDGWSDFYRYAYPLLEENGLPATVFLATDFIGSSSVFWTDRLACLMKQKNQQSIKNEPAPNKVIDSIENQKGGFDSQLETSIDLLKKHRNDEIQNILLAMEKRWGVDSSPKDRAFLSWEEVKEMQNSGLIAFGSHTAGHPILTNLKPNEIESELKTSWDKLVFEKAVDPSFIPFCYPNGNHNDQIVKMVKEAGYSLAVTTQKGWNGRDAHPFMLKRIGIHQDMTSTEAMFGCRITGIF